MKLSTDVRASITDDGIILLDIATGQIFSANAVGARIWSGLEAGLPMAAIVDRIAADSGVARAIVERDAHAFVDALKTRELIAES
jgi:hypothetical protein